MYPADHPFWKLAQTVASIVLLGLWLWHTHHGGAADAGDGAGLLGAGFAANVLRLMLKKG